MTFDELDALIERLHWYDIPDRTLDERSHVVRDMHAAADALEAMKERAEKAERYRDENRPFHFDVYNLRRDLRDALLDACT